MKENQRVEWKESWRWNPGQLPHNWTAAHFTAKHASAPHNPDIANVFFRAALIESWGRGIEMIRDACQTEGFPEPEFRWDSGLWVEFPYAPEHVALSREGRGAAITTKETPKKLGATSEITDQVTDQVTGQVARLLEACVAPMSGRQLRESLDLKGHANFRRLYLVPALKLGLLRMTLPDKPNSRLQKYFLSSEGAALLSRRRSRSATK